MKINSCPFCGYKTTRLFEVPRMCNSPMYQVKCEWCEACGPRRIEPEEAIKMWNRVSVIMEENNE